MAKKAVATLRVKGAAGIIKVIRTVKNERTGAYSFKEEIVPAERVQEVVNKKN